jgi:uncharacterized protein
MTATEQTAGSGRVPDPCAEVHETHTGIVLLVGDRAYKAKKPLRTDFLDFSTPDRRERACKREVELNSRLAASSYLGVGHLSDALGGPAEPVIVMRRRPDARRLATMVKRDQPVDDELAVIAEVLAEFHHEAHRGHLVDKEGKVDAVSARWQANISELERFSGVVLPNESIQQVQRLATRYLAGRAALFTQRISDARIVDGHGDLLADDIFCLDDGPALLDCLEFDDRLRYVDAIDDAAFLAMDLEFLGRKDLADYFLGHYSRLADDPAPRSLKDFYIAYRAVVRAKTDCVRFAQGVTHAAADASRHLNLAIEHLRAGSVRLTLIGGAPGTGKTTLAHALAERVGAVVISSDDVRRELQRSNVITGPTGVLDAGLYSADKTSAVYDALISRAHGQLADGRSVILDATWAEPHRRDLARELAAQTESAMLEIACSTPVATAQERVETRSSSTSDVTPHLAGVLGGRDDHWDNAHRIDTSRPLIDCTDKAEELWRSTV